MAAEELIVAAVRKRIAQRRQEIAEKWPKNLSEHEYLKHVGRHEELESFATAVQEAIRKANSVDEEAEHDPETDAA
jgi:hypothetical protein